MENEALGDRDALAAIEAGQAAAAARIRPPWWYYPTVGAFCACLAFAVGAQGRDAAWSSSIVIAVLVLNKLVLVPRYRAKAGVWLTGFEGGTAKWWTIAWIVFCFAGMVAAVLLHWLTGSIEPAGAVAAVLFVGTLVYGRVYTRALRRRLRPVHVPAA